jgi:hypothetical protein
MAYYYWKVLSLSDLNKLTLLDYNLLELGNQMADVLTIDSGNDSVQNGNIVLNIGAPGTYQELTTVDLYTFDISEVSGKYDDRFDDVGYYVTGGL